MGVTGGRPASTTHGLSGSPRLALQQAELWEGQEQPVFYLRREQCTIGSHPDCDLVLSDIAEHQATVLHDERDEWVLLDHAGDTRVHGVVITHQVLRSGARIDIGPHALAYYRDMSPAHERPQDDLAEDEIGRQRPQPPRRPTTGPAGVD